MANLLNIIRQATFLRRIVYFFRKDYSQNCNRYSAVVNYYDKDENTKKILDGMVEPEPYILKGKNLIGIKYWIENKLKLCRVNSYSNFRPLWSNNNSLIFYKCNSLFIKQPASQSQKLCKFNLSDKQYCELIDYKEEYYALRDGGRIYVSRDLKNWKRIYNGKRGIKNSMILIEKNGTVVLVFIEYSAGISYDCHCVLEYSFKTDDIHVLKSFGNLRNENFDPLKDYARHIHVIQEDPYTGDLYLGTGDEGFECSIFVSKDKGNCWMKIAGGGQQYRTLSFIFTEKFVFWNTDTYEKQFLNRLPKANLFNLKLLEKYPLINSALWCTMNTVFQGREFTIMSSNGEGALFDNNNRIFAIEMINDVPTIYEIYSGRSKNCYSQKFPCCCYKDKLYFYDAHSNLVEEYIIVS